MKTHDVVLVVDDSSDMRHGIRGCLELEGFEVAESVSGAEAVRYLETQPAPAAIVLDLVMPDMDGWAFLKWRQKALRGASVPVIVTSGASGARESVTLLLRDGERVRVLEKPFDPARLIAEVRQAVDAGRSGPETGARVDFTGILRILIDTVTEYAICLLDPQGNITTWNDGAARLTGYVASEIVGRHFSVFHSPEGVAPGHWKRILETALAAGRFASEGWYLRKDGSRFWAHSILNPLFDAQGASLGFGAVIGDITERKLAANDFERLFDLSQDMLCTAGFDGFFKRVNAAWTTHLGYAPGELLGRPYLEFVHADDRETTIRESSKLADGVVTISFENRYRAKDGSYRWLQWSATPLPEQELIYSVARDVTEAKRLDDQLRLAQKMEAVGRLAGGVAHDFNNVLTAIMGYSELMLLRLSPADPLRANGEEIAKAARRAAALTHQLLAFSRKQILKPRVVSINATIGNMMGMLRRLIPEDITITQNLSPSAPDVLVDPGQLEQVVLNLVINARDAMVGGGTVTIETHRATLDESYCRSHVGMKPGEYLLIAITDTGHGMDRETQKRIFEPFFTTKKETGTGLGLSTVFGIVKQSRGDVWVYSEVGRGSTFKVYLPRASAGEAVTPEPEPEETPGGGEELILLAEDDDSIRTLVTHVLEQSGYVVELVASVTDALRVARDRGRSPDLLLSDVVMPDLSGRALADGLQPHFPAMKVMFASGYTDDLIVSHGVLEPGTEFLQKPFSPHELLRRVRKVLDGGSASPGKPKCA